MATFDTVRKAAAHLPGVEVSESGWGRAIKVNGKMIACEASNKSAEPKSLVVRIDIDQREALIAEAPAVYYVTEHYVKYPSVVVRLPRVKPAALKDLLQAAARFVAASGKRKSKRT